MIKEYWNDRKHEGISRVLGRGNPDALNPKKIADAQRMLETPIGHLRAIDEKLRAKEEDLFRRIVASQRVHNNAYAEMYANEMLHVRKMKGMVNAAKLSMEQVQLRLNTVSELGDIVVTLSPCMSIIRDLGPSISGMVPEAATTMQDLSEMMGDMMDQSRIRSEDAMVLDTPRNRDAMSILDEAHSVITREAQSAIPKIPESLLVESEPVRAPVAKAAPAPRQREMA